MKHLVELLEQFAPRYEDDDEVGMDQDDKFNFDLDDTEDDDGMDDHGDDLGNDDGMDGEAGFGDDDSVGDHGDDAGLDTDSGDMGDQDISARLDDVEKQLNTVLSKFAEVIAQDMTNDVDGAGDDDGLTPDDMDGEYDDTDDDTEMGSGDELSPGGDEDELGMDDDGEDDVETEMAAPSHVNPEMQERIERLQRKLAMKRGF